MSGINKEKAMQAFGKAVDTINGGIDKAADFAKEHEIDRKIHDAADTLEKGAEGVIDSFKDTFGKK